ncbi:hypothetical protein QYM36_018832, partial [Artemia franciscana]
PSKENKVLASVSISRKLSLMSSSDPPPVSAVGSPPRLSATVQLTPLVTSSDTIEEANVDDKSEDKIEESDNIGESVNDKVEESNEKGNIEGEKELNKKGSGNILMDVCMSMEGKQEPVDEKAQTPVAANSSAQEEEEWNKKTMNEKERDRFHKMTEEDKGRSETEMKDYMPAEGAKGRGGKGSKRKAKKDPNAPKRPLNAFFWFCKDQRMIDEIVKAETGLNVGDAEELGWRWADIDEKLRKVYEDEASEDRRRYEVEMAAYKKELAAPAKNGAAAEDQDLL